MAVCRLQIVVKNNLKKKLAKFPDAFFSNSHSNHTTIGFIFTPNMHGQFWRWRYSISFWINVFDTKIQFWKNTCDFDKIAVIKSKEVIFNKRKRGDFLVCEKLLTCFLVLHFTLIVGPTPFKCYAFYVYLKNCKKKVKKTNFEKNIFEK